MTKPMTRKECHEMLGLECLNDHGDVVTLKSLTEAIMLSIGRRLVYANEDIEEFGNPKMLGSDGVLLSKDDELLFLEVEDGTLDVSCHVRTLFDYLEREGLLSGLVSEPIATELARIRAEDLLAWKVRTQQFEIEQFASLYAKHKHLIDSNGEINVTGIEQETTIVKLSKLSDKE